MLLSMLCVLLPIGVTVAIVSNDRQRPGEQGSCDEVRAVGHGVLARGPAGDEQEQCGDSAQENSDAQSEGEHPGVEPPQPQTDHRAELDVSQSQAGAEIRQGQADAPHCQCAQCRGEGGTRPVGIQDDGDHSACGQPGGRGAQQAVGEQVRHGVDASGASEQRVHRDGGECRGGGAYPAAPPGAQKA